MFTGHKPVTKLVKPVKPVRTGACGLSLCSYAKDGVLGGLDLVAPRYEITPEIIIADATRCRQIVVS